jgi:hypothetical protein
MQGNFVEATSKAKQSAGRSTCFACSATPLAESNISAWQIKKETKREERRGLTLLGDGRAAKPETVEQGEDSCGMGTSAAAR